MKVKKLIVPVLAMSLLLSNMPFTSVKASEIPLNDVNEYEENQTYDGNYIKVVQTGNETVITDKRNGEQVTVLEDQNKFTIIDGSGEVEEVLRPHADVTNRMGVPIPPGVDPSRLSYTYVDTYRINNNIQGDVKDWTYIILSLVPHVGSVFFISSVIDKVLSTGSKTVYIEYDMHYAGGYQYYKYVTRFYANSDFTNRVGNRTDYVKMW